MGRLRLCNLAEHLCTLLQPWQAGGVKSVDPEVLFLATKVDFGPGSHPYVAALDYRKVPKIAMPMK